jgi:MurNAc alpha-1-phosphate uridylyltransferase
MQVVILAGGLATRMRPLTETIPKVLLPVAGRPFADWLLKRLAAAGFTDVVMAVAHLAEQVEAHVGTGQRFGLRVRYSRETGERLGTGGALRLAAPLLAETFLVTYGDSYLPFDYASPLVELNRHDDCDGVMSVYRNAGALEPSNVRCDGTFVLEYEKNTKQAGFDFIDYGALALRRDAVLTLPQDEVVPLEQLQTNLAAAGRLRAVIATERFYEVGSKDGLAALEARLSTQPF